MMTFHEIRKRYLSICSMLWNTSWQKMLALDHDRCSWQAKAMQGNISLLWPTTSCTSRRGTVVISWPHSYPESWLGMASLILVLRYRTLLLYISRKLQRGLNPVLFPLTDHHWSSPLSLVLAQVQSHADVALSFGLLDKRQAAHVQRIAQEAVTLVDRCSDSQTWH